MSKNVIFCYSGTGNCLDLAKNIAKGLGDTDIIMMRRAPVKTDVTDAERVGFIVPCYGGGLPGDVESYLDSIKISPSAYTFAVGQYAGYLGCGLHKINERFELDLWAGLSHQCSCIWLFPHQLMLLVGADEQRRGEGIEAALLGLAGRLEQAELIALDAAVLDILRHRPDEGAQAVVIALDQGQVDGLGVFPQAIAAGAVLGKGMDIGIVPEAGDLQSVAPQDIDALVGAGSAADVQQRFHVSSFPP